MHWPSALAGLALAIVVVVSVSWLASGRGPATRPFVDEAVPEVQDVPSTVPSPAPDAVVSGAESVLPAERVRVANTRGANANLRAQAGTRAARLKPLPEGTLLELIGPDQGTEGTVWRNVREPGGVTGWVSGQFLSGSLGAP